MFKSLHVQHLTPRKLTAQALSEIAVSLTDIDWRLLYWLLRYPLQRVDDLALGAARWASRATIYRHVRLLEASGLVESVLPKTPGTGKRLYHLSNPGLHLLAMHLGTPARALARRWQTDEAGLMRLLPRLPTILVLQDVINGLITHVADAMTIQGRRPELVRWTWQRNMTHRFLYREKRMRFFADGAVALCIRTRLSESGVLDQWYGVLFLSTGLDDERLMRLRLERLLYWRESPERWSCYQHMLPVLIMANSYRQRDHWQRAVESTAQKLCLDPLAGALAYLPHERSAHLNPWLLNWRMLASEMPCHLQQVLKPMPHAAFPSSLCLEENEDENRQIQAQSKAFLDTKSPKTPTRLSRLVVGDLAKRAAQVTQDGLDEPEGVCLLGLRLTACQWSILRLLLAHPLLSDEELAAVLGLERKSVRCSLYELHQRNCLESVVTLAGKRWHLCERGLHLIAAANHIPIRTLSVMPGGEVDKEGSRFKQRGESWLLEHIQHTAGIYSFFASLARAASKEAGHDLCWWETEAMCERRYHVGEQWYNLRPDALASYRVGGQQFCFWLEWDRGTMNVRDLAIKFSSYRHYITSRQWAREDSRLPFLICVAPDVAQERRIQRVAQVKLGPALGLVVWTTTEELLSRFGSLAPVWLKILPQRSQVSLPSGLFRQFIFDLVSEKIAT